MPRGEEQAPWDRFRESGEPSDLAALLARQHDGPRSDPWSVLVLPAARWAALHPRLEYAEPLRAFRAAFAADPQCRDGWRDRVLAETDGALAACQAR